MLFQLLWEYVEGCDVFVRPDHPDSTSNQMVPLKSGLEDRCSYPAHNPTVGAYVQHVCSHIHSNRTHEVSLPRALSVDLWPADDAEESSTIFVDCLVQLPNLRTLEVFSADCVDLVMMTLELECAQFPSIRELWVNGVSIPLVKSCPNVESVTVSRSDPQDIGLLCLYGRGLRRSKRVAGILPQCVWPGELRQILTCSPESPLWKSPGSGRISKRPISRVKPRVCVYS